MGIISLSIPQVGLPNSTEDPKIASDFNTIMTWANGNVDLTNLSASVAAMVTQSQQSITGSASITNGTFAIEFSGNPLTITLPTPTAGTRCSVYPGLVTAANPVTVTTPSGGIYGLGVTAASSIVLGSLGQCVTFHGDGSNYEIVSGYQDTGWALLSTMGLSGSLSTPISGFGGTPYSAAARLVGDKVSFQGALQASGTIASGTTLFTLPAALRPPNTVVCSPMIFNGSTFPTSPLQVLTSGVVSLTNVTLGSGNQLFLDNLGFFIT